MASTEGQNMLPDTAVYTYLSKDVLMAVGNSISVVGGYCYGEAYCLHLRVVCWKMAQYIPEMVLTTYQTTPCPKADHIMNLHHCENLQ